MNFYIKCRNLAALLKMEKSVCWDNSPECLSFLPFPIHSWSQQLTLSLLRYFIVYVGLIIMLKCWKALHRPVHVCRKLSQVSLEKKLLNYRSTYSDCYSISNVLDLWGSLKRKKAETRSVWLQQSDCVGQVAQGRHSRRGASDKGMGLLGAYVGSLRWKKIKCNCYRNRQAYSFSLLEMVVQMRTTVLPLKDSAHCGLLNLTTAVMGERAGVLL